MKICVVTGSRAEYGILKSLLRQIDESEQHHLYLLVSGMHLLEKYGCTLNEIKEDGFSVAATIPMYLENESEKSYYGFAVGNGIINFTRELININPDILIVFGDRLEPFAASVAAATLNIPIAHIHGGDKTDSGIIDETLRHSISRFANIHLTATSNHSERLVKMGEESWRIFEVGALGLDAILDTEFITKKEIAKKINLNVNEEILVCIYHSFNLEKEDSGFCMHELMEALKDLKLQTVIIYPNNDKGSDLVINEIETNRNEDFIKIFKSLPHKDYINLLNSADLLIGNSSSGIVEAPSLKLPVVNVGSRNIGRDHAENVLFIEPNKEKIKAAIERVFFDDNFKKMVEACKNPYGDGNASAKILDILNLLTINNELLEKKITY